jgi:hypothetical protein
MDSVTMFKGKTVAVIGSAPKLLDHPHGPDIDQHHVVFRTNLHGIHGKPEYFGSRTDARFLFGWHTLEAYPNIKEDADCKLLITRKRMKWLATLTGIPAYFTKLKMTSWLESVNPSLLGGLDIQRGKPTWNTTSGSEAIALALFLNASSVTLYGFAFDEQERWDTIHEDGSIQRYPTYAPFPGCAGHTNPKDEVQLLRRVMNHYPVYKAKP